MAYWALGPNIKRTGR